MEAPIDLLDIDKVICRMEKLSDPNILVDPEYTSECKQVFTWLKELKERRDTDCTCEIISIKNEKIDSGFMCIHCGRFFAEYQGEQIKAG